MSGTRHAEPGSRFHQERYASSSELERGFNAVLVKIRCEVLRDPKEIELVWFLQYLSMQRGGIQKAVEDMLAAFPERLSSPTKDCAAEFIWEIPEDLTNYCLNPSWNRERLEVPFFSDLSGSLISYMDRWEQNRLSSIVITETGRKVLDALDYAEAEQVLVLAEGAYGTGKTFMAKAWCEARPGRRRYVQAPSSNDNLDFFRTIAEPIGVSHALSFKAQQMRARINDVLQAGHLSIVIDEAHYLFPQASARVALPGRINWLLTALTNYQVPVALVTTPQFTAAQASVEKHTHWASGQFIGRISRYVKLPEALSDEDLRSLARFYLPKGDARSIEALVHYAKASKKRVRGIEHAIKAARQVARTDGREEITFADIKASMVVSVMPSDSALNEALSRAAKKSARNKGSGMSKVYALPSPGADRLTEPVSTRERVRGASLSSAEI